MLTGRRSDPAGPQGRVLTGRKNEPQPRTAPAILSGSLANQVLRRWAVVWPSVTLTELAMTRGVRRDGN